MTTLDPVELARLTLKDAVQDVVTFRGEITMVIQPDRIVDACLFFRDTEGLDYNFLSDVTAVDYYGHNAPEQRFAVCYHLYSMLNNRRLRLKVYLPEDNPHVPSITSVWEAANYQEREAYDLMGIIFDGHPDLRRIMMPDEWENHPQRKDYPLGYEQVQFSFNYDDINRQKPYAQREG